MLSSQPPSRRASITGPVGEKSGGLGPFRALSRRYAPFDAFLAAARPSKRHKLLKAVQSITLPPIAKALPDTFARALPALHDRYRQMYGAWRRELLARFHLCFYGYGSKRALLEEFFKTTHFVVHHVDLNTVNLDIKALRQSIAANEPVLICVHSIEHLTVEQARILVSKLDNACFVFTVETVQLFETLTFLQESLPLVMHDMTTFIPFSTELGVHEAEDASAEIEEDEMLVSGPESAVRRRQKGATACRAILASMPAKTKRLFRLMIEEQMAGRLKSRSDWAQAALERLWISKESQLNLKEFFDHSLIVEVDEVVVPIESAAPKNGKRKAIRKRTVRPEDDVRKVLRVNLPDSVLSSVLADLPH